MVDGIYPLLVLKVDAVFNVGQWVVTKDTAASYITCLFYRRYQDACPDSVIDGVGTEGWSK